MNRTTKITEEESNRRLEELAIFLDNLPKERFDYGDFVGYGWTKKTVMGSRECSTTACALGWAACMPQFNAKGLVIRDGSVVLKKSNGRLERDEFKAASDIFGISYRETQFIFSPADYRPCTHHRGDSPGWNATPKQVAKHIRRFTKNRLKCDCSFEAEYENEYENEEENDDYYE